MKRSTMNIDLNRKVALITGGGGILCGEMAEALSDFGACVAILDYDEEKAKKRVEKIKRKGGKAIALVADVTKRKSLEDSAKEFKKHYRALDILINGAGGNSKDATTSADKSFFDLNEEAIRWVFELNALGTIFACQVFGKIICETRGAGNIINISSMNAFRPLTRIPAYSSAKSAVSNFTQWLAVHMALNYSPKIRVNAIAPGFFITEQNRFLLIDEKTGKLTERGKRIIDHTPFGEFGKPKDLISTLLWLLSEESRMVSGVIVPVDGGFSAYSGV